MNWWRRLTRRLKNHTGMVDSWTDPEGNVWVGFLCSCGELHGAHIVPEHVLPVYLRKPK